MTEGFGQTAIIDERKRKLKGYLKNSSWIYILALIVILGISFYIRTVNIPDLKDVTTGGYTLGPDLDPFLALRWAKDIVATGSLMKNDTLRYVPLGYDTTNELVLWPYGIVYVYDLLKIFNSSVSIDYAGIVNPVIFFMLAIVFMFLFVKKVFEKEGKLKSNLIALLATLLFSILPLLLHRTVAGIPEKEPPGIAFMLLTFYFLACMFSSKSSKSSIIYGLLAGIATGLAGLFWGGFNFAVLGIGLAALGAMFFTKISKNEILGYGLWIVAFTVILGLFTEHYGGIKGLLMSSTSAIAYFTLVLLVGDYVIFNSKLKEKLNKIKLPRPLLSSIIVSFAMLIIVLIFDAQLIGHIFNDVISNLLNPFAGNRFTLTVAENAKPYFDSWIGNFGKSFFWMLLASSVLFVYELTKSMKYKWLVISAYALFIVALIFSKYSAASTFNGSSFWSQVVFIGGFIIFGAALLISLIISYKRNEEIDFDKSYMLMLALFVFGVITARSAVRLFYLLAIPAPIVVSFGAVKFWEYALKAKEDFEKVLMWAAAGLFAFLLIFSIGAQFPFLSAGVIPAYAKASYNEAQMTIPNAYTLQWQYAMNWTRSETPKDAVFAHWWDYGYWVQSIGERPTIVDGGNAIVYWDFLVGRHVLTARNETEALEFLKTHDASYLLIDSSDIGKYPAYSSIGSDENYDRYSWINTFQYDAKSSKETRNETVMVYTGASANDADIVWQNEIIPEQSAGIAGFTVPVNKDTLEIGQPSVVMVYQGKKIAIPVNCIYIEYLQKKYTFENGLDSCVYIIPKLESTSVNNLGTALYISEKGMNALWVKLYLFNETENNGKNFDLALNQPDLVVDQLRKNYNMTTPDLIFYQDLRGSIKIWKINYPADIKENPDYLKTDYPDVKLTLPRGA